jgi:hypothetical protein
MKYTKYPELKAELKDLAKRLRYWKSHRKYEKRLEINKPLWQIDSIIFELKHKFRHRHIAYCLLRGRSYDEVEQSCKVSPNFGIVNKIMEEHGRKTLRASA